MAVDLDAIIHPTATIEPGATIGPRTRIWHYAHVMPGAVIGTDCVVGQGCYIGNVTIGDRVRIQNHVSIYDGVSLEDGTFCGPSCVFTNVINPRAEVSRKDEYRPTRVLRGASIGANATIVCGSTLGEYAFIGAGAVVTHDVKPHALIVGVPARQRGWMCRCGEILRINNDTKAQCPRCELCYQLDGGDLRILD